MPTPSFPHVLPPRFSFRMLDTLKQHLRVFPRPDGHSLVGEYVGTWSDIPDRARLIVLLVDGTHRYGTFYKPRLATNAEFALGRAEGGYDYVLTEFVESVWLAQARISGEALFTNIAA